MVGAESVVLLPKQLSIGQINEFVNAAGSFESEIEFFYKGIQINAKGLLSVNLFFLSHYSKNNNEPITLRVEGCDAQDAIKNLSHMHRGLWSSLIMQKQEVVTCWISIWYLHLRDHLSSILSLLSGVIESQEVTKKNDDNHDCNRWSFSLFGLRVN